MVVYIYDGSFEGILTCIYEAYYRKEKPDSIISGSYVQGGLADALIYIETDAGKYEKVYKSIITKISSSALEDIYAVYLSEADDCAWLIYKYLRIGYCMGDRVRRFHTDDIVARVNKICRRVYLEKHKMLGFVRFSLVDENIYYSSIEPDNNILALIAPHFAHRYADQNFIIHDLKRKIAVVYNMENWHITDVIKSYEAKYLEEELTYRKLWKEFFKNICIESRKNIRLQRMMMPGRYWKHIHETNL